MKKKTLLIVAALLVIAAAIMVCVVVFGRKSGNSEESSGTISHPAIMEGAPSDPADERTTILADGEYIASAESSSAFLKILVTRLFVHDGKITAAFIFSASTDCEFLYVGATDEAVECDTEELSAYTITAEGRKEFEVPLSTIGGEIPISVFSSQKNIWRQITVTIDPDSIASITSGNPSD